jgi:hypothetical protein
MPISHKQTKLRSSRPAAAPSDAPDKPRDSGNAFAVLSHDHTHKSDPEPMIGRKRELHDHERGIAPGLKLYANRMPQQSAPDHGDHYE